MIAGGWQLMNLPDPVPGDGGRADVSGMIRKVDGRLDGRLRIWLEVDRVHRGNAMIEGKVLRLSLAPEARCRGPEPVFGRQRGSIRRRGAFFMARRMIAARACGRGGCQRLCGFAPSGRGVAG